MSSLVGCMEAIASRLERTPWRELYRVVLGFSVLPINHWLELHEIRISAAGALVLILAGLRVVPLTMRRLLPFSKCAQEEWLQLRVLGKRFDSYQWQKLFWIGLGMSAYLVASAEYAWTSGLPTLFCVAAGAWGLLHWRGLDRKIPPRQP